MLLSGHSAEGGCVVLAKQAPPPAAVCPHCQNNRAALGRRDDFYSMTGSELTIPLAPLLSPSPSAEGLPQSLHSSVVGMASLLVIQRPGWIWHLLKFHLRNCNDTENTDTLDSFCKLLYHLLGQKEHSSQEEALK